MDNNGNTAGYSVDQGLEPEPERLSLPNINDPLLVEMFSGITSC